MKNSSFEKSINLITFFKFRCQKFNRHKQRQGFSTLDQNLKLDKEKFCECEGENQIELTKEEDNLYNIVEEDCECCSNVKSNDTNFDELKKLDNLKMI